MRSGKKSCWFFSVPLQKSWKCVPTFFFKKKKKSDVQTAKSLLLVYSSRFIYLSFVVFISLRLASNFYAVRLYTWMRNTWRVFFRPLSALMFLKRQQTFPNAGSWRYHRQRVALVRKNIHYRFTVRPAVATVSLGLFRSFFISENSGHQMSLFQVTVRNSLAAWGMVT